MKIYKKTDYQREAIWPAYHTDKENVTSLYRRHDTSVPAFARLARRIPIAVWNTIEQKTINLLKPVGRTIPIKSLPVLPVCKPMAKRNASSAHCWECGTIRLGLPTADTDSVSQSVFLISAIRSPHRGLCKKDGSGKNQLLSPFEWLGFYFRSLGSKITKKRDKFLI